MYSLEDEHIRFNKEGKLGLWALKTDRDETSYVTSNLNSFEFWDKVNVIVGAYTKVHPQEMEFYVRENLKTSGKVFKDVAGEGGLEMTNRIRLPVGLLRALEAFEPDLFQNRALYNKFRKKFPGLCISTKRIT